MSTSIYRKPTHTNQYLQWDSHHAIGNKYSVINSLLHRAKDICSNQDQLEAELTHTVLSACKYPSWAIKRMKLKNSIPRTAKNNNKGNRSNTIKESSITVQYNKGLTKKSGIIYRFKCDRLEFDEGYIGETSRTFGERFKEHIKAPSPIHDHNNTTGHTTSLENFSIVGREEQNLSRLIKESMFIRVNSPSPNKNIGKYHLLHIWDEVLINNRELKLK